MKKLFIATALASTVALTTGCAVARSPVNNGFLFTDVKGSESVGSAASGTRYGRACSANVLGLVAYGDSSARTAASRAGINHIQTVDYSTNTVLGVWAQTCTLVYGE
ncbi:MAG TPA: TRL-like family protein [Pseudomonadales bacterium]|nr:TRL-like family protein [Pseudomonadales bacterium]